MINFLLEESAKFDPKTLWIYGALAILVVIMMVVPMFTNRKRAKEYNNMIEQVGVGDTVRTIGGVIGRITKINEQDGYKTIILETGAKGSKTTMELDIASIGVVLKSVNAPKAPVAEPAKAEVKADEPKAEPVAEVAAAEQTATSEQELNDAVHGKTSPKTAPKKANRNKK